MCLAVPGKVLSVKDSAAEVDFGGVARSVSLDMLSGVKPGDYVLVHAGFAVQVLSEDEALKTIQCFREIYEAAQLP
ncbi:MAG: HypC/HybG/HupF family hydrogenase formation chaperone [Elusimicrobiaceae bacterium]